MKKFLAMLLAVALVFSLGITAFAANSADGSTGKITVSNATAGQTYAGYKIFDVSYDGANTDAVAYSIDSSSPWYNVVKNSGLFVLKQIDGTSKWEVVRAEAATDDAILALFKENKPANITPDLAAQTPAADGAISWDAPFGYYFITSSLGAFVTIDTNHPNATVVDKNQTSKLEKWILEGNDKVKLNNVNLGDKVPYELDITAPNYKGDNIVTNYFVYDKMDEALTFNGDVKVTVNGTEITNFEVVTGEDAHGNTFEINIPWVDNNGNFLYNGVNNQIVVTFSATVNQSVKVGEAMENEAAHGDKQVPVKDKDDHKPAQQITEPTEATVWDRVESHSVELKIMKVDEKGNALPGAKFKFVGNSNPVVMVSKEIFVPAANGEYYKLTNGKYTEVAPVTKDSMKPIEGATDRGYVKAADDYKEADVITVDGIRYREYNPATDSEMKVYVLDKANAYLYDSTTDKYTKIVTVDKDTAVVPFDVEAWVDENGVLSITGLGEGTYTFTELVAPDGYNLLKAPIEVVVSFDETDKTFSAEVSTLEEAVEAVDGVISFNVVNQAGTVLPSTGGIGTTIFYVLGSMMVLAAGVIIITKKRMESRG